MCRQVFEHQLQEIVDIRAVYNFNDFFRGYRPRSADKKIRMQFAFTFESRGDTVVVRSKKHCGADTPWGPWNQILPHPDVDAAVLHDPDAIPAMSTPKPWPELREIAPQLTKFYERQFVHPVHIPTSDLEAMRGLLRDGPPPPILPPWIDWDVVHPPTQEAVEPSEPESEGTEDEWEPFLQPPRRKRARTDGPETDVVVETGVEEGSETPSEPAVASSDEEKNTSGKDSFPYPVGTFVARDFGNDGIFSGIIENHYADDCSLCMVRYTDGDTEDLDIDEIQYAIALYKKEFE